MPKCAINVRRSVTVAQACGQGARRSIFGPSGYQVYYRTVDSPSWLSGGFIADTAVPLQASLPPLADGEYEIKVELQGYHWDGFEDTKRGRFKLVGGVLVATLPQIYNLGYAHGEKTAISWLHKRQHGVDAPEDFALWTSVTSPVDTSGAPLAIARQDGFRRYQLSITQASAMYAAVAARLGAQKSPVAEIYVPLAEPLPGEPEGQYAQDEVGA